MYCRFGGTCCLRLQNTFAGASLIIIIIIIIIITIITIIIVIIFSFMHGIYTHIPETNCVPREYSVAAILLVLFVALISFIIIIIIIIII